MKLDDLRGFQELLNTDYGNGQVDLFYKTEDLWKSLDGQAASTPEREALEQCIQAPIAHYAGGREAWFYLTNDRAAVRIKFSKSPGERRRSQTRKDLERIRKHSSDAYRVAHNQLTHLLSRDSFRSRLNEQIDEGRKSPSKDQDAAEASSCTTVILALDIDNFKQINDTWGHLYGDEVLKTFARRLENTANNIRLENDDASVAVGHPSGEEFLIAITAVAPLDKFKEWATRFCECINRDSLPNDIEWKAHCDSSVVRPEPHERSVTASIGMVVAQDRASSDDSKFVSGVLDRADTALYKAKSEGKNRVVFYDDILVKFGRVLDYQPDCKVVAIDVGADLGVKFGQEFRVFSPNFSGHTAFQITNGRSTRTLGKYPRVEAARVVVFDVQREISFAYVADDNLHVKDISIETGSHLEAIPAGSISHLLKTHSRFFPSQHTSSAADLHILAQRQSQKNLPVYAATVRFSNETEYLEMFGSVGLNAALAALYEEVEFCFPKNKTAVLDDGAIATVGTEPYDEARLIRCLEMLTEKFPRLKAFSGVFNSNRMIPEGATSQGTASTPMERKLCAAYAVEFSRIAATRIDEVQDSAVQHFSYALARASLVKLRNLKNLSAALDDYEKFLSMGLDHASIFNQGGIIYSALKRYDEAAQEFLKAINRDPDRVLYRMNLASTAIYLKDPSFAIDILNELTPSKIIRAAKKSPNAYAGYVFLLSKSLKKRLPTDETDDRFFTLATELLESDHKLGPLAKAEIEGTLQTVTKRRDSR